MEPRGPDWLKRPILGVLLDISGVLRDGDVEVPGSVLAFQKLRESGLKVKLVTNESQVTRETSLEKLLRLGYRSISIEDIVAPIPVLLEVLKQKGHRPHLLTHPNVHKEFTELVPAGQVETPSCVVIGDAAEHFTYDALNEAFRALLEMQRRGEEMKLYSLGKGRYYQDAGGLWLDVGAYTAGLEYALDIHAEVVGKPSSTFFHGALHSLGLLPQDVVMIGDDIVGDVKGAQDAGMRGVLVKTGKFRQSDCDHPSVHPDGIVDDLAHAVGLILAQSSNS